MKSAILNDKVNRFLACVLIAETLSVTLKCRMKEIEFIRSSLNQYNPKAADSFGDWVDTFEKHVLALADAETVFAIMLMKAYTNGRKYRELLLAKNPRQQFPFDDELRVFQQRATEMNYDKELYKLIEI